MDKFEDNREKLRLHIENVQKQSDEVPILNKMLDIADLNFEAYQNYPGNNYPFDLENSLINQGLDIFSQNIGEVTPYQGVNLDDAFPTTISGATGSYHDIRTCPVQTDKEKEWKTNTLTHYNSFLQNWNIEDLIRETFKDLKAKELLHEFNEMLEYKEKFRTDIIDHSAFGNKTRNVFQHFKGILKKSAQISLGEKPSRDRHLSWPKMGKAIIKNPKSNRQFLAFKELGDKWQKSFSDLSGILKDYSIDDKENLIDISNEVLLILESFISVIDIEKLKNAI